MSLKQPVRRPARGSTPAMLLLAAHPRVGLGMAVAMAGTAALAGRPLREIGLVLATVLVGQAVLGWHNDLVDHLTDARNQRTGKPLSDRRLDTGTVWFALCCAVLLLVPLSVSNGLAAGACYLAAVVIGCLGNVALRRGPLSFLPWALSFALYPAFLSYGGWGGRIDGNPPEPAVVVVAALLGVAVHLFTSGWGLVADDRDGSRSVPLRLGRRVGATRVIVVGAAGIVLAAAVLLVLGATVGLSA